MREQLVIMAAQEMMKNVISPQEAIRLVQDKEPATSSISIDDRLVNDVVSMSVFLAESANHED